MSDQEKVGEGGEQHDRRWTRTPETAMRAQNVEVSLACEGEHGESEGLHLARAQARPPRVTGQTITIRGEKKSEKETKGKNWQMSERSYGSFSRAIPLEFSVDPAKVKATFDKGVLKVHVPKPPEAKSETKKIAIKG